MGSLTRSVDVELPPEGPPEYIAWTFAGPYLHAVTWDGRAFDMCALCACPMCEDDGDYITWVYVDVTDVDPDPDPRWVTMCEDCATWWYMGLDDDEEDW